MSLRETTIKVPQSRKTVLGDLTINHVPHQNRRKLRHINTETLKSRLRRRRRQDNANRSATSMQSLHMLLCAGKYTFNWLYRTRLTNDNSCQQVSTQSTKRLLPAGQVIKATQIAAFQHQVQAPYFKTTTRRSQALDVTTAKKGAICDTAPRTCNLRKRPIKQI